MKMKDTHDLLLKIRDYIHPEAVIGLVVPPIGETMENDDGETHEILLHLTISGHGVTNEDDRWRMFSFSFLNDERDGGELDMDIDALMPVMLPEIQKMIEQNKLKNLKE